MPENPGSPKVIGGSVIASCEDVAYKTQLWNQSILENKLEYRFRLYEVVLADKSIIFVLAESQERAISQATCRGQGYQEQKRLETGATATLVQDFKVQGWGKANFNAD